MSQQVWSQIDDYFVEQLVPEDEYLLAALRHSEEAGLPAINVAPNQGKLLYLLAKLVSAKRILEIGTLGGYSGIWLARALPDAGRLITLEFEPRYAEVAAENIKRAGLEGKVEIVIGPALESLDRIGAGPAEPFDLVFIDADKQNNPEYFQWALKLSRPGSLIVIDNVVRDGKILDVATEDVHVQGVQRLFGMIKQEPRVEATAIQTVGSKGWDGLSLVLVK